MSGHLVSSPGVLIEHSHGVPPLGLVTVATQPGSWRELEGLSYKPKKHMQNPSLLANMQVICGEEGTASNNLDHGS